MSRPYLVGSALVLSWAASASLGALIGVRHASNVENADSIKVNRLEVVDSNRRSRIVLNVNKHGPSILLLPSSGDVNRPLMQLSIEDQPSASMPIIKLNDTNGNRAVRLDVSGPNRGLLSFSTSNREGELMVGRFGTTDDGSDTGAWGLDLNGKNGMGRWLGIKTVNGEDRELVWPASKEEPTKH